jgi:hypothetical protein
MSLLEVDPASFRANFNRRAFTINHHLSDHPLFSLPQLTELSFSITFQTRMSNYRNIVYTANSKLRKWGVNPAPFGRSPWRDSMKWYGYRALRRARSTFHKRQAPDPTADRG